LAGAQGGGPRHEEQHHEQFDRKVRWVVRKYGVGRQDAEDIVQDSMVELAPKWGTCKALEPEALLTTIIKRKVFKRWRRPAAAVVPLEDEVQQLEAAVADPAVTAEQRDTIRRAASVMSPIERRIVLGRARQDSAVTIAAEEGMSAVAVRSTGHRMERRMAAVTESEQAPDLGAINVATYARRLPKQQRTVFTLALEGYEPAAIAKILHTSNNARVNLYHAKRAVIGMLPTLAAGHYTVPHLIGAARRNRAVGFASPSAIGRPRKMPNQPRYPA